MSILNRKVSGTWQQVATASPENDFTGYNPYARLSVSSVQTLLASAGLASQRMIGHTERSYLKGVYRTSNQWYSSSTGSVKNELTLASTSLASLLSAAVGGAVSVSRVSFTEGPITPPFWTVPRQTHEIV